MNKIIDGDMDKSILSEEDPTQVSIPNSMRAFGMIGLVALCGAAFVAIIYDGISKTMPKIDTKAEEVTFKAPRTQIEPYIIDDLEPALSQPQHMPQIDPMALKHDEAIRMQAMRIALEQQKELEKRIKSPQLVYVRALPSAKQIAQPTNSYTGEATLFGGGASDENIKFANEVQIPQSVQATQLRNLSTLIAQGELISGILETAIQSDLPGMLRAITSDDVYSFDGSNLLIPKGTRLVGEYRSSVKQGQSRVFVIWTRLIRPDGVSINIGSIGTDALGRSGLSGAVNTHFMKRFGSSILLSMIDGALDALVSSLSDSNSSSVSLNGGNDFSRSAEIALENSIGIKPTIHIDQGSRIKIFVGQDLDFSNVENLQRY